MRASFSALFAVALVALGLHGCSVNPATGKRQLVLISESQEKALGLEAHEGIVAEIGVYDDEALGSFVGALGSRLAGISERPELPWTFRLLDDPVVNAFALPGGYVYVTRGILAHLGSEAELAGVMGHEVGHVTARHGVNQMSKSLLAQIGIGVTNAVAPDLAPLTNLAESGVGLLFLKYGRDDERQADELGLRYSLAAGYDPHAMIGVFEMLDGVSARSEGGSLPGWLSTHPRPEARREHMAELLAGRETSGLRTERDSFLRRLDGLVYGSDPRQGYFRGDRFLHPTLAFEITFPSGWRHVNQRAVVGSVDPDGEALVAIRMESGTSAASAAEAFFSSASVTREAAWRERLGGRPVVSAYYRVSGESGEARGIACFVEHAGVVLSLRGLAAATAFDGRRAALEDALASFREVTDKAVLKVQPLRLETFAPTRPVTPAELARGGPVSAEDLALLNNVDVGETLPVDRLAKRVVGSLPPD